MSKFRPFTKHFPQQDSLYSKFPTIITNNYGVVLFTMVLFAIKGDKKGTLIASLKF